MIWPLLRVIAAAAPPVCSAAGGLFNPAVVDEVADRLLVLLVVLLNVVVAKVEERLLVGVVFGADVNVTVPVEVRDVGCVDVVVRDGDSMIMTPEPDDGNTIVAESVAWVLGRAFDTPSHMRYALLMKSSLSLCESGGNAGKSREVIAA